MHEKMNGSNRSKRDLALAVFRIDFVFHSCSSLVK